MKMFQFGFKDHPDMAEALKSKEEALVDYNVFIKTDGNNLVAVYNSEENNVAGSCIGTVKFSRASAKLGMVQKSDIRDAGLMMNANVIAVSKMMDDSFEVTIFPSDDRICRNHKVKEITSVKFYYPNIILVKGGKEILIYNITEDLYYYILLGAPYVMDSST